MPTPTEQAHARITALIAWVQEMIDGLNTDGEIPVYYSLFKDPYPQSGQGTSRPIGAARKTQRRSGRDAYRAALAAKYDGDV